MSQARSDHVIVEIVDGIGHIRLNRPDARNALSPEMKDLLTRTTLEFERDPQVRAVLISAVGDDFMVGADLKRFKAELDHDQAEHALLFEQRVVKFNHYFNLLHRMPKPVILAAQGHTVGVGFCMASVVDFVIAADDVKFMLAYRHIALSPDAGITWALPRLVGERRAKEIVMFGETIDAQKALDWGIANWVVPKAELQERALAIAARLARGPTMALARGKKLVGEAFDTGWDAQLNREAEYISECVGSADHLEGVTAFLEKRKPAFKGR
ncbi:MULTISPECIES: enoyl-CoA hydratase/isomerase family protein [unclassified Sphingobium]|uniref:enoyl-CoA hydratase/isomerase family protein n=1 Tax=unclassified Sphingobium TaxID=2611147 RepID=UPI000D154D22|nr:MULTISPECIES: enoyl-CoA hydratase-related protein [unclassified Sphingobium]MBG6120073.1 2-(1,2-epoxy-1,2-dihydrophenyl)acetyl-CoA isomerase [Sphingobium sp. JAI105]PSO12876.1 enoyl-CoA hydratase [Sphingobium sp. AEW4]TWD05726.1 2-(1,2-epoxy-1,2-dihydrophenyl)acetyl-CoA isomerase [Sphingobium sp. AEW010]TWD23279.1 2-(1,2-epoxy-1,2-dihydrophenyl)acetyl-CoA isomerase [Sphingobium sp. AEW013]TWD25139.1 2-(1,2-epoxy-1,2-dihydrophenyl)acetyl-CoA isomerase [Sphingobium sp. AEW001]